MNTNALQKRARKLFAERVRLEHVLRGWSQESLGGLCALHRTYIGSIERAERNISIDNIEKIANALNVTISAFFIEEPKDI